MTNTLPTVDIKGKEYVLVKDRVLAFNDIYPNGSIQTELVSPIDSKIVVIKATVMPDVKNPTRVFVDYSQAVIGQGMVNMTAALENASTSATGRALALMGIGVVESIASADEMVKSISVSVPSAEKKTVEHAAQGEHYCGIHQADMKLRNFDGQTYYDHRRQIDGVWNTCTGAGWKSQQVKTEIPERQIDERNDANEYAMYEEVIH